MPAPFIQDLMAGRFEKFAGLKVSGTVPLQQEFVNQALNELVQNWSTTGAEPRPSREKSRLPLPEILALVKRIQVRADPGVINVDFEIGV